jgi:hypothetical protein
MPPVLHLLGAVILAGSLFHVPGDELRSFTPLQGPVTRLQSIGPAGPSFSADCQVESDDDADGAELAREKAVQPVAVAAPAPVIVRWFVLPGRDTSTGQISWTTAYRGPPAFFSA